MKAALVEQHGGPDVIRIADLPLPVPSPAQVGVRVVASGVQPFDTYVRQGREEFRFDLPRQLGNEFSGVIDEVGRDVDEWRAGEEVLGPAPLASHADYVLAGTDAIVRKPPDLAWDEAGALSASGHTACTATADLEVEAGDTLLVHGAAGGAGSAVVQLARQRGARVIGTASLSVTIRARFDLEHIADAHVLSSPGMDEERSSSPPPRSTQLGVDGVRGVSNIGWRAGGRPRPRAPRPATSRVRVGLRDG